LRRALRVPRYLYRWNNGRLLGYRFLLLTHVGRASGATYETVLEVVEYKPHASEVVVMSGFGKTSDWFRNVRANGFARVTTGGRHFDATSRTLPEEEAVVALTNYERRNRYVAPVVRLVLSRFLGWRYRSTQVDRASLVNQLPLVAFTLTGSPSLEREPGARR
jgi:deazaflavin-dependent oxidoreductase (nitroreductase family)